MVTCPNCGRGIEAGFRFCPSCGADLQSASEPERRQLATLLFCDVSGSTSMGERLDAESVREIMSEYFHEMRSAIERHGGTVEKFIGDAVVAIFGVPTPHEDDPIRAVRAAWEMQQRVPALNDELDRRLGSRIALRIGVNTGEVVAGDASTRQSILTGDAVNVAARLEQAAGTGEVLLGDATFQLVRDAVSVEPVQPLALKGKAQPVAAHRLRGIESTSGRPPRRFGAAFVGRAAELAVLRRELASSIKERRARRSLVVGMPGVGKSRLVSEFLADADAAILRGGCLPYGEGITWWALAEAVRQAAGIVDEDPPVRARDRIAALVEADPRAPLIAERVSQALGLAGGAAPAEEVAWALRRTIESVAVDRALVLVLDDVQWAESALLDVVEAIVGRDAPIFLVCIGRPEVLETRPAWLGTAIRLESLDGEESDRLVDELAGETGLSPEKRSRVIAAAGGNPLFVEELLAMVLVDPMGEIPSSLDMLLAARLGQLPNDERRAAERASIEGQRFHRSAVIALSDPPVRPNVPESLDRLAGQGLVRPAPAAFANESAFEFRHLLIRDAAYRAMLKRLRADLHERFADWLERIAGERALEFEEIMGYHLEQAYRYREELGPVDEHRGLAERAARRLGGAGTRAADRGDAAAAVKLIRRALALMTDDDPSRAELELTLGDSLWSAFDPQAVPVLRAAAGSAVTAGRRDLEGRARLSLGLIGTHLNPGGGGETQLERVVETWIPVLEELGDERGLAKGWLALANIEATALRFEAADQMLERALAYARRSASTKDELDGCFWLSISLNYGPLPAEEAIRRLEGWCADAMTVASNAVLVEGIAKLHACLGRFDDAHVLLDKVRVTYRDLGLHYQLVAQLGTEATVWAEAGDLAAAERSYREGCEELQHAGETGALCTFYAWLADILCEQGRFEEAERLTRQSEEMGDPDDLINEVTWRPPRARALAHRGDLSTAETVAREGLAIAERGDWLAAQATAQMALAEVLLLAGRRDDARASATAALSVCVRKGNEPMAERVRARLREIG